MRTFKRIAFPATLLIFGYGAGFLTDRFFSTSSNSVDQLIKEVNATAQKKEWDASLDFFAAALQKAPGDIRVFEAGTTLAETLAKDDGAASEFDIVVARLDAAVPFLPTDKIRTARSRLAAIEMSRQVLTSDPAKGKGNSEPRNGDLTTDILVSYRSTLALVKSKSVPLEMRARALRDAEDELYSALRQTPNNVVAYAAAEKELIESRASLVNEELPPRVSSLAENWIAKAMEFQTRWNSDASVRSAECDDESRPLIADAGRLLAEMGPFSAVGVASADRRSAEIAKEVERCVQVREWRYNRWVNAHIDEVKTKEEENPSSAIKLLSQIDEKRLASFLVDRYERHWKKSFESPSVDKLEAVRLRILRGVVR